MFAKICKLKYLGTKLKLNNIFNLSVGIYKFKLLDIFIDSFKRQLLFINIF